MDLPDNRGKTTADFSTRESQQYLELEFEKLTFEAPTGTRYTLSTSPETESSEESSDSSHTVSASFYSCSAPVATKVQTRRRLKGRSVTISLPVEEAVYSNDIFNQKEDFIEEKSSRDKGT